MSDTAKLICYIVTNVIWCIALIRLNNYWSNQVSEVCEMAKKHNKEWYEFFVKIEQNYKSIINKYRDIINEQIPQQKNND